MKMNFKMRFINFKIYIAPIENNINDLNKYLNKKIIFINKNN